MYREALSNENSRRVAQALAEAGGTASFSQIEKTSGVEGSVLLHHLNKLQTLSIVESPAKGTYRLRYKTPLCFLYEAKSVEVAYLGLLGHRKEREKPETEVALRLLRSQGLEPKLIYVVTSPEALGEWKTLRPPYQWILCYEEEIIDIDSIREKVRPPLEGLLKEHSVILDCTSATKPATIAYYELAQTYLTPLIYVYEETGRMKWIQSRGDIAERLGIGIGSRMQNLESFGRIRGA
ncbi:hypothetical protein KEJ47_07755 [Candidatus Bathyarchaeota archaeon]|nr:hypothetical protein [Candidatus Bathyarchaeota archaeon]